MSFDFLADEQINRFFPQHSWLIKAHYLKREAWAAIDSNEAFVKRYDEKTLHKAFQDELTQLRSQYLRKQFIEEKKLDNKNTRNNERIVLQAKAQSVSNGWQALEKTGAMQPVALATLPSGSAVWTLRFELLTPLLTGDDDPFYLFDNPLRKDHVFGVPYLSAAAIKGLAADAYQRAFPGEVVWRERGQDDPERTLNFRNEDPHARRLFGVASDDDQADSLRGRLHFSPLWLPWVQYVVMNKMDQDKGIGSQPIHFEAAAPVDDKGNRVTLELRGFYFNPLGAEDGDAASARADLARFIDALAHWWPVLGLGAKRLAGYGAIKPTGIEVAASGWRGWPDKPVKQEGREAWLNMAAKIAGDQ